MGAPKGNRFWEIRSSHGRNKIFETPQGLLESAYEYFNWVEENPLEKAVVYQGEVSQKPEPVMRAMTVKGLCIFLGVNSKYFNDFSASLDLNTKEGKDFSDVIMTIREIIDTQKFEGASAGLLNPNIIARDLGLADKKDHSSNDGSMAFDGMTSEQRKNRIAELLNKNSQ